MKKTHASFFLTCILSLSLLHSPLSAEEPSQTLEDPSLSPHVEVNVRPMRPAQREKMKEKRQQEVLEEAEKKSAEAQENIPVLSQKIEKNHRPSKLALSQKKQFLFSNYQPLSNHWLTSLSLDGSCLELEDGSHWKTSGNYYTFLGWKIGDRLEITPNQSMWSQYNYYITNKYTGGYIAADLFIGPVAFGPYTHWVAGIDYVLGHVFLENGSAWTIADSDVYLFSDWAINDTVIIGSNNGWFSVYDTILINVNINSNVRALQY